MPDNIVTENPSSPVEALANALGDMNLKLVHIMTRQRAVETVLNYYYTGFSDKVFTAWLKELEASGMSELAVALQESQTK
jgi:hypothetical protein